MNSKEKLKIKTPEDGFLNVENLRFSFHKIFQIKDISFSLKRGQIGCILGESGSGKTTLLRILGGFQKPSRGVVSLRKQIINSKKVFTPPAQRKIGFTFQESGLFPHLTVKENIFFGLKIFERKKQREWVSELMTILDVGRFKNRYPHQLSGGERQRVGLARALASQNDILIMDEPFSHLDESFKKALVKKLKKIIHHLNTTVLFVTHSSEEAFLMSDVLGVMEKGRLIQWGPPQDIYNFPNTLFAASFLGRGHFLQVQSLEKEKARCALGDFHPVVNTVKKDQWTFEDFKPRVFLRPENILVHPSKGELSFIEDLDYLGDGYLLQLKCQEQKISAYADGHYHFSSNRWVRVHLKDHPFVVFQREA